MPKQFLDPQGLSQFTENLEQSIVADKYSISSTYAVGDYCIHENLLYRCTTAISSGESWDPAHWTQILIGDELVGLNQEATTTTSGLMSATDKVKLDGIESGAEVNVQSDWNAVSGDALILNKPTLGEASSKGVSTTVTSGDPNLVTSGAVYDSLNSKMDKANPTGTGSLSIGRKAETTPGSQSVAVGYNAEASGARAVALGHAVTASGANGSFAEGYGTTASGEYGSHAEGRATTASGNNGSHAEGYRTSANGGSGSHAEGYETQTTSDSTSSHAEGYQTTSGGLASHSEGVGTIAQRRSQHVFGDYNIADTQGANANAKGAYIEIVGKGSNDANRSNARTLDWNGNETLAGDLIINGNTSVSTALTNLNPKKVDIFNSTLLDYRRCVIALCRVSTTDNTSLNSYSAGTISFHRDNGLNGVAVIDFGIENDYYSAYSANVCSAYSNLQYADIPTASKNKTWSWCSFKHNDIYYAGIEYYIADAMNHNIIVDYVGNFEPFAFAWYDTKNSEIIDTEFSNSVSYTTPRHKKDEYFSERLYANKPINTFITGTGTEAEDKGSGVSPRFFPAIWTFDVKRTALNGDTVTIKVPVAGHDYGVYLSIDNGTNYYPIVTSGTSRLTTHYPVGNFVSLVFDDTGSASSMFPLNGGDSRVTVTGGVWRVLNYYDSGNNRVRQTLSSDNTNRPLLLSYADNTTTTTNVDNVSYRCNNIFANPSTGDLTIMGNVSVGSTLSAKMDKADPTGTGSLSINRRSGTTVGNYSTTEGRYNTASGAHSHSEGYTNTASGNSAHCEGRDSTASGNYCHSEGGYNEASGDYSHAEGARNVSSGAYCHSEGFYSISNHRSQHVFGEYNVADPSTNAATSKGTYVEIVGRGTSDANRLNARTLDWSGNETIAGTLTQSSDAKLKDVKDEAIPDVSAIKAVRFTWKEDANRDDSEHIGYIAQDVEKVLPFLVKEDAEGNKVLDYIAFLVAKIDSLEKRISELEK